ncbi:MAG: hypothetical protein GF418_10140 [Chitinivibrionales bacterium]|nr:hypothetical protein [Chitinivibrionales bacterium]MBD3395972.1 hypothetical protein [Chitinivibrionales bacterium]
MSRTRVLLAALITMCAGYASLSHATWGIGAHYILDGSVKMDAVAEQLTFDDLALQTDGFGGLPAGWVGEAFGPEDIPIYFDRGEMLRTPFGLGGKLYVDIIPIIDCIEIGGGFAAFQYDGKIKYPTSIDVNPGAPATPGELLQMAEDDLVTVTYDSLSTNLEDIASGVTIPGISQTPYAKIDMGITIRKYIPLTATLKWFKPYGGVGFDVMFATPVPSAGLVNDAIGEDLSDSMTVTEVMAVMQNPETANKIVEEIIARLMTPHFGMNLGLGFILKPPAAPIGLYVDGKMAIPFGKLDDDADVRGFGFKLNMGLCLHFSKRSDERKLQGMKGGATEEPESQEESAGEAEESPEAEQEMEAVDEAEPEAEPMDDESSMEEEPEAAPEEPMTDEGMETMDEEEAPAGEMDEESMEE